MTASGRTARGRALSCAALTVLAGAALGASPAAAQEPGTAPGAASATPTVGIAPNTAPRAGDDLLTTQRDLAVTVDLLANDVDPDGDPLSILGATSAGHGVLSFTGAVVTYTPDPGFSGADGFTYLVSDGRGGEDIGQVRVTVVAPLVMGPHPPSDPHPDDVATVQPVAPQPPALPASDAAPMTPDAPALPAVPVVAAAPSTPLPLSPGAGSVPGSRIPAVAAGPALAAMLPLTGDSVVGRAGLGAGLAGLGVLLCLLGRRRTTS